MKYITTRIIPIELHRIFACVVLLLFLSGCLSTTTATKPSVVQQIKQQELKDTIDEHVAEFKTIKPAIERLIAMENDFKVMVSQIATINNPGVAPESLSQVSTYEPQSTPVALDPHNTQPELEVLYVSDTAQEPEPIFALEPIATPKIQTIENPDSQSTRQAIEPVVTFQAAEPAFASTPQAIAKKADMPSQPRVAQIRLFPASSYTTCAPVDVTSDARKYGIHVASFNTLDSLPRGWHESVERFPDFCQKGAVIQKVVVKSKQFYSMRVGPYVSRSEAKSICYALKKQKQYCRVTDFTGETL